MPVPLFGAPALAAARPGPARHRERRADVRGGGPPAPGRPLRRPARAARRSRPPARAASASRRSSTRRRARFERQSPRRPEQWWAVFFPIWPDLEADRGRVADADDRRSPRPRRPAHPHPRLGRHRRRSRRSSTTSRRSRELDVIAITDHERIDAALAARAMAARSRACRSRSSSARRSRPAAATCSGCSSTEPIRPCARCARRSPRSTSRAACHPGPSARALPAVRPGLGPAPAPGRAGPALPARRARGLQPDDARAAVARPGRPLRREHGLARGRQQRRARARRDRAGLDHVPGPDAPTTCGAAIAARRPHQHGIVPRAPAASSATFGRQLRKYGRDVRDEVRGRLRRDGTGRDLGYPGGRRGRRATSRRAGGRIRGARPMKIGLVTPYVYPLPGGVNAARPLPLREPPRCAATTSASSAAATAPSAPREGDIIRLG